MTARTLALCLAVAACATPNSNTASFSGLLSGIRTEAVIQRIGTRAFLEIHALGGEAGTGSVTAPAEVRLEVISTSSPDGIVPPSSAIVLPLLDPSGALVPALDPVLADRRAAQFAAVAAGFPGPPLTTRYGPNVVGDVVASNYAVFNDTRGAVCRIDARLPVGGSLSLIERDCAVDRDVSLKFTGSLRPSTSRR